MTINSDLAAAFSTRLNCSIEEAREHVRFIMKHADDPNFALHFVKDYGWDYGFQIYYDVVRFLYDTA